MMHPEGDKIAIPASSQSLGSLRPRTARACDSCRQRKAKCDGAKPTCTQCQIQHIVCSYSEVKRKRDKQEHELANAKVEEYESLLQDIFHSVEMPIALQIENVFQKWDVKRPRIHRKRSSSSSSSSPSSFDVGRLNEIDIIAEDLNRSEKSRATGYMGKNSEIAWLQQLEISTRQLDGDQKPFSSSGDEGNSFSLVSYYMDDIHLPGVGGENFLELPPKPLADKLFNAFVDSADSFHPIIRGDLFTSQYERLYSGARPGKKWLAILNMTFAIGARHCELLQPDIGITANHTTFFNKARNLNPADTVLYGNADLQEVQLELLIAFYFLATFQVNRAWNMVGIAARSAIALGLNLRSTYSNMHPSSVEARNRTWWAIFLLENMLSVMTSRTSCLGDSSCSTSPPLPVSGVQIKGSVQDWPSDEFIRECQLNWTLYQTKGERETRRNCLRRLEPCTELCLFYLTDLAVITHAITNSVNTTDSLGDTWAQIENQIELRDDQMQCWLNGLHPSFVFADERGKPFRGLCSRFQISLALNFYSARIVLMRPCLTRPKPNQKATVRSPHSRYSRVTAISCLNASLSLIAVFPDRPDIRWIYNSSPWWNTLHFLMQAVTILLIYVSGEPFKDKAEQASPGSSTKDVMVSHEDALSSFKKAARWMYCIGEIERSFSRAFEICNGFIRRIALKKALDISDLPSPSSPPPMPEETQADTLWSDFYDARAV